MPKIFIAYRRQDSKFFQNAVYDEVAKRFGAESVVRDVDNIPVGFDFRQFLQAEVARCDALLAVIGDQWLPLLRSRIKHDIDFLRLEIEAALARDIPVVPVLVGTAEMPPKAELPPEISPLVYRQGVEVRRATLNDDLTHLVRRLQEVVSSKSEKPKSGAHDLALRFSVKPKSGGVGILFKWTVTVRNDGKGDLREVKVRRGRSLLKGPFRLPAGKGRRFTFEDRYDSTGLKRNSVSVTGVDSVGKSWRTATRLAVRIV